MIDIIETAIKKSFDNEKLKIYKPSFSPSNFPYCAREHFIYAKLPDSEKPEKGFDFYNRFYTEQGNAIHQAIQDSLGLSNLIFGDWWCTNFKCTEYKKTIIQHHKGTPKCEKCGKDTSYKEIELKKDVVGINGFVDGILPDFDAILEIKTKGSNALKKLTEPIFSEWVFQASSYIDALKIQYSWTYKNIIMLYINRDNPKIYKIFLKQAIPNILQNQLKLKEEGEKLIQNNVLPEPLCEDISAAENERRCVYAPLCFSPSIKQILNI